MFQNLNYKLQKRLSDVLPHLPNKVFKSDLKGFPTCSYRRVARKQIMRHFTSNGTNQCQNGSSDLLTLYQKQPRSTRIVVVYLRPAFSATKRTDYALIGFDQQAEVSQGQTSRRKKKLVIPRSMVMQALSWFSRRASQHLAVQSPVHP